MTVSTHDADYNKSRIYFLLSQTVTESVPNDKINEKKRISDKLFGYLKIN